MTDEEIKSDLMALKAQHRIYEDGMIGLKADIKELQKDAKDRGHDLKNSIQSLLLQTQKINLTLEKDHGSINGLLEDQKGRIILLENTVYGHDDNPGHRGRLSRLEDKSSDRDKREMLAWGTMATLIGKFLYDFFSSHHS